MEDCEQHVARLGSNVLIDVNNGERLTFMRLHPSASIKIGNRRCSLAVLIDAPYGTAFELQRGSLVKVAASTFVEGQSLLEPPVNSMECCTADILDGRDNRNLVDDNTAQKLSTDDIHRMRRDCTTGKDIVDALIANSTTFQNKTAYSQEKYKKKKQMKYAPLFVVRRPSARRICEAYLMKSPQRIGFLRMDTMALMLSLANVGAHAEVLVMDMVGGLLTAAIAERMGGFGSVCNVYSTVKPPSLDIVGLLNLNKSMAGRVFKVSIWDLSSSLRKEACIDQALKSTEVCKEGPSCKNEVTKNIDTGDMNAFAESGETIFMEQEQNIGGDIETSSRAPLGDIGGDIETSSSAPLGAENLIVADEVSAEADLRTDVKSPTSSVAQYGKNPESEDLLRWAKHGFTSLIISAPEYEPWSAVQELLPFLSPSSPFVVYHRYLQPLAECMHELQMNKMAVALEIYEPWLREYQVLPSRTHPHMQMNANGGFVLSGIKITSA